MHITKEAHIKKTNSPGNPKNVKLLIAKIYMYYVYTSLTLYTQIVRIQAAPGLMVISSNEIHLYRQDINHVTKNSRE